VQEQVVRELRDREDEHEVEEQLQERGPLLGVGGRPHEPRGGHSTRGEAAGAARALKPPCVSRRRECVLDDLVAAA
jgi:hypothetical protein